MEQAVQNLQQDVLLLRVTVQGQAGFPQAAQAIHDLVAAHSRKEAPCLVDVKGLGRPKEFSGQRGTFPAVVEENRIIFRWSDHRGLR